MSMRWFVRGLVVGVWAAVAWLAVAAAADAQPAEGAKPAWFKGNVHAHSFWSDGDDFPEMAADWYKSHGYQFLALSDHNVLMRGAAWVPLRDVRRRRTISETVLAACRKRFGDDWVELRGEGDQREVRLKTLDEVRGKLEEPNRFLMIQGEEITGHCDRWEVHMNAIGLAEPIRPAEGDTVVETLRLDVAAVAGQARRLGRPILAVANHPNWKWFDIPAEDLAAAAEVRLFELCNNSPGSNFGGSGELPSCEQAWDIANAIRLEKLRTAPLWGIASDDTHDYHRFGPTEANPGRGWIMVRAGSLSPAAILAAVARGDFYASTGVTLRDYSFDPVQRKLSIAVVPEAKVKYTIKFIGTLAGSDLTATPVDVRDPFGRPGRTLHKYGPQIGQVLKSVRGNEASYELTGKELYVRVAMRSDKRIANRAEKSAVVEEAWCQPVGWESRVK